MRKISKYYLEHGQHGWTAVGLSREGRVVNFIPGGKADTAYSVFRAAKRHWPGAKATMKPKGPYREPWGAWHGGYAMNREDAERWALRRRSTHHRRSR